MRRLRKKKGISNKEQAPKDSFFPKIQTQLSVGKADDAYEKEADHVAEKVVAKSGENGALQTKSTDEEHVQEKPIAENVSVLQKQDLKEEEPTVQPKGEEEEVQTKAEKEEPLQKQEEEEAVQSKEMEEETLQKKGNTRQAPRNVEAKLSASKGQGQKMDPKTKMEMEHSFGADFSSVNIHTDSKAETLSKELGAQAFTTGNDIYFNEGKYDPNSQQGKKLLAHELTHTLQQNASHIIKMQRRRPRFRPRTTREDLILQLMAPDSPLWRRLNPNEDSPINCPATAAAVDTFLSTGEVEAAPAGDNLSSFSFSLEQFSEATTRISDITRRLSRNLSYAVVEGTRSEAYANTHHLIRTHYFTILNFRGTLYAIDAYGRGGVYTLEDFLQNDGFESFRVARGRFRVRHHAVDLSETNDPLDGIPMDE